MKVLRELLVDDRCAYLINYGELHDGTDHAETAWAHAEATFPVEELRNLHTTDLVEGYSPIYTCAFCGQENEGEGQYKAVVLAPGTTDNEEQA